MVKKFLDASIKSRRPYESNATPPRRVVAPPPADPKTPEAALLDRLRAVVRAEDGKKQPTQARVQKGRLLGLGFEGTAPPIKLDSYNDVLSMLLAKKY
jgi:hypothetical protein